MDPPTSLDSVLRHVWSRLEEAAENPGHVFRTLTFGTVGEDAPHLRTVVLRRADREVRVLAFHTNRYAQKVEDIRATGGVAWHGWDPDAREQVRLRGRATIHTDDDRADAMWAAEDPASLDVYVPTAKPGTSIEDPDAGRRSVPAAPVTRADVAPGREQFAVIRTVIEEIDWLHLHPDGHARAQFTLESEGKGGEGTWVVP